MNKAMFRKNLSQILALTLIVFISLLTRGHKLGAAPAGINADEAGQGYAAYSMLKTGKDEFGKSFPILFRSSEDFKAPIYTYISIPSIAAFGLTPFAIRLTSSVSSVLTVVVLYFLVKKLSGKKNLAFISAALLAISPWHILFGRTAYECSLALFLFLFGCLVFYESLSRAWLLIIAAILFSIAIPAYHSERVIIPLLLFVLFLKHYKTLLSKTHLKYLLIGGVLAILISVPTLSVVNTPGFFARVSDLNILSVGKPAGILDNYDGVLTPVINNKIFLNIRELGSLYLSYFSPRFIFLLGDSGPRSSFPEVSTFFVWQFPFYIYGLYLIIKKKNLGELKFFTLAFLLVSPITAAMTRDPYSTTRALQMVIPLTVIIALGITTVYKNLSKNTIYKLSIITMFIGLVIYSLLKLYSSVLIQNEHYRVKAWEYGWQQVASKIKALDHDLPVVVDNSRNVGYIQLAFFLEADPFLYQKDNFEVEPHEYYTNMRANEVKVIGNIVTRPLNWEKDLAVEQYLIGDKFAISMEQVQKHKLELVGEVYYPDKSVAFRIVKTPLSDR